MHSMMHFPLTPVSHAGPVGCVQLSYTCRTAETVRMERDRGRVWTLRNASDLHPSLTRK